MKTPLPSPAAKPSTPLPLYGMISSDGGVFTMVFHPEGNRTHAQVTGSNRNVFGNFAGSQVPVVDLRTVTTAKSFSSGVREEYGPSAFNFSPARSSLKELCEEVTAAGGCVWPLTSQNFRAFAETGISPGSSQEAIDAAAVRRMQEVFARTQYHPAISAADEIKGEGLFFGKAGVSTKDFLLEHVRVQQANAANLAPADGIPPDYADPETNRVSEMRIAQAHAIADIVTSMPTARFEAALCRSLAATVDEGSTIMTEREEQRERTWISFAKNLGGRDVSGADPVAVAQRNSLRDLHTAAVSGFYEYMVAAHNVKTTDAAEMAAVSSALRTREEWLAVPFELETPPTPAPRVAGIISDEPPTMDAFVANERDAAEVSRLAGMAAEQHHARETGIDR